MAGSNELADLIQKAAEIAMGVPENLQEAAFNRALDALMGTQVPDSPQSPLERGQPPAAVELKHEEPEHDLAQVLISRMDSTEHAEIKSALTVLERSL